MIIAGLPIELFDGRTRLLPCQREQMKAMKDRYDISYKALSEQYGISKTEAFYVCNPEAEERKRLHNAKNSSKFYDTDKHREHKASSRAKKRTLVNLFNIQA